MVEQARQMVSDDFSSGAALHPGISSKAEYLPRREKPSFRASFAE
jgi:hypothetical protein